MFIGCLLAIAIGLMPRFALILAWLFSARWDLVWDSWFWPLLGIVFLPYTTVMYMLAWTVGTGLLGGTGCGLSWVWYSTLSNGHSFIRRVGRCPAIRCPPRKVSRQRGRRSRTIGVATIDQATRTITLLHPLSRRPLDAAACAAGRAGAP